MQVSSGKKRMSRCKVLPVGSTLKPLTSKPICTCTDTTSASPCSTQVTLGTPSTLSVIGTVNHFMNYICIGLN